MDDSGPAHVVRKALDDHRAGRRACLLTSEASRWLPAEDEAGSWVCMRRPTVILAAPYGPTVSGLLVPGSGDILAEDHRPRVQIRMMQKSPHEAGRSANAGPVVVPQRRHQP